MKNKKIRWIVIIISLLVVSGVAIFELTGNKKEKRVVTEKAISRTIYETVSASGKVQPELELAISPDVSGEITQLFVHEGDSVIKGQLLARINPDLYTSDLDRTQASLENNKAGYQSARSRIVQAEARLKQLESEHKRNKILFEQKVISQTEWENIQSSYTQATAELDAAKLNLRGLEYTVKGSQALVSQSEKQLGRTQVFSPISGIVTRKLKNKGERVVGTANFAGTDMLKIADLNSMLVVINVNENDIARINIGDSASVEVDAYRNRKFRGVVTEIGNSAVIQGLSADQVTNFEVKVRIIRESYTDLISVRRRYPFRPGMSASVIIYTNKVENCVSVPIRAVTLRDTTHHDSKSVNTEPREVIFYVEKGVAKIRVVKTGIQDDEYIEIAEGVTQDMEVITEPALLLGSDLKDGDKIRVVKRSELNSKND